MHESHEPKPPQYWLDESNLFGNMNGMKISSEFGLIGKYVLSLLSFSVHYLFICNWPAATVVLYVAQNINLFANRSTCPICPLGPFKSLLNWKRQSKVVGKKESKNGNNNVASIRKPRNCAAQRNWILKHWNEYRSFRILQCILMKTLLTWNEIRLLCCAHTHTHTLCSFLFSLIYSVHLRAYGFLLVAHIHTTAWVYRLGLSCQHLKNAVWIVFHVNRFVSIFCPLEPLSIGKNYGKCVVGYIVARKKHIDTVT